MTIQPLNERTWAVLGLEEAMSATGKSYEEVAAGTGISVGALEGLAAGKTRAHTITIATLRRALGQTVGVSNLRRGW